MDTDDMEQDNKSVNTSTDVDKVLQANICYLKKKRKFEAEQVSSPLKHQCWDRNLNSDSDPQSDDITIESNSETYIRKGKAVCESDNDGLELKSDKDSNSETYIRKGKAVCESDNDGSELKSDKDSNNFDGDNMDYIGSSTSNEAKQISEILKSTTYSSEGSSSTPNSDKQYPENNFGLYACMSYDETLLELECQMDSLENETNISESCKEKEIEEMISNGMPPSYVLSSGKWSYRQENQEDKKLTIDKEFEEYFSMLML